LKPAVVTAIVHLWVDSRPLSASIGEATTTLLLLAVAAIGVVLELGCEARRRKKGLLRPSQALAASIVAGARPATMMPMVARAATSGCAGTG
jgi:hypothetical protein